MTKWRKLGQKKEKHMSLNTSRSRLVRVHAFIYVSNVLLYILIDTDTQLNVEFRYICIDERVHCKLHDRSEMERRGIHTNSGGA